VKWTVNAEHCTNEKPLNNSSIKTAILQYQLSTTVMDLVKFFALFVFMLTLLCFCVAAVFSVNKDLYENELS